MKTILVPTDFSKCATKAMHYALKYAAKNEYNVILAHSVTPAETVNNNVYNAFYESSYVELKREMLDELTEAVRKKYKMKGDRLRSIVQISYPISSICDIAERENVDMIIMGSQGASGLKGILIGSTASGVIERTSIPVLILPPNVKYTALDKVTLATDFTKKLNSKSSKLFDELCMQLEGPIDIVHVYDKKAEKPTVAQKKAFVDLVRNHPYEFHIIHDKNIPNAINLFAESSKADVLVMISHKHNLFSKMMFSTNTKQVAKEIKCPLLVLHSK